MITSVPDLPVFKRFKLALFTCFAAGSLSALAMAPFNVWAILFVTLPAFYLAFMNAARKREAFALAWCFSFGYFVFGLYWIGNAMLVDGNPYKWVYPLALLGFPALLGFFWGPLAIAAHKFLNLRHIGGWVGFCGFIALCEFCRGTLFTGFPWNMMAYTWSDHLPLLQILRYIDTYTLNLLTILWASSPVLFFLCNRRTFIITIILCALSFGLCYGYGAWSLQNHPSKAYENIDVKIVQPNIDQAEKWDRSKLADHFNKQIALSKNDKDETKITYIIWPETAFTYRYANDPDAMLELTNMLKTYLGGAYLFTGMLIYNPYDDSFTNSLVMIDQSGNISNIYDKHHLVPFGEYIPLSKYIPLRPIVEFSGFKEGPGPRTLSTPENIKYSPLICYEIIFPYGAVDSNEAHPDLIINATNDAWYGVAPGPYQHFVQTQYRAIENSIPVIRSANTGFSGAIDPFGRVLAKTSLYTDETLTLPLPKPESSALPQSWKLVIFLFALISCLGLGIRAKKHPYMF